MDHIGEDIARRFFRIRRIDARQIIRLAAAGPEAEAAVTALAKAGTLAIIGVYPEAARFFPIGLAMNKNLALNMGNCHHRKYIPRLIDLYTQGRFPFDRLIRKYRFEEINQAAHDSEQGQVFKPVLTMAS